MSATIVETLDISICSTEGQSSPARAEASRANGRLSRGPVTPEGKARSSRNGCKDGLTGKGIVLPLDAAAEVDRREAGFARSFRPTDEVERALVRQMALGSWRGDELARRIIRHDARISAARFANWEPDEHLAAVELGRRLRDDPEDAVARLLGSSAGCAWLIDRWTLLGHGLTTDDEGEPGCAWTDANLALAVDLLGRSAELRHLDPRTRRLERLHAQARAGSHEGVAGLREFVAEEVAALERRRAEVWEGVEEPRLRDWRSGLEIDLGPDGTRLRRYEAAANRLFRSAWTQLERLRKERDEPLIPPCERGSAAEPAARAAPPTAPVPEPVPPPPARVRPESAVPSPSLVLRDDPPTVLDFWIGGPPWTGISPGDLLRNKTNPRPSRPATGRSAARRRNLA
jgi:hypothetical protein